MGKDPAMPLYVNDWLSSRRVQAMSQLQELAYFRLLAFCWSSGDASIPDDDDELAVLSRMGKSWLKGGSQVVRRCFQPHPNKSGYLTNARLFHLWQERQEWRRKSHEGGIKSGQARKLRTVKGGSTKREPNANSSSSSSSSIKKETKGKKERFIPPTVEQVRAYCSERHNGIDPQAFVDYYEANGWVQGKSRKPLQDWKAAVRTFEANRRNGAQNGRCLPPTVEDLRNYNPVTGGIE